MLKPQFGSERDRTSYNWMLFGAQQQQQRTNQIECAAERRKQQNGKKRFSISNAMR